MKILGSSGFSASTYLSNMMVWVMWWRAVSEVWLYSRYSLIWKTLLTISEKPMIMFCLMGVYQLVSKGCLQHSEQNSVWYFFVEVFIRCCIAHRVSVIVDITRYIIFWYFVHKFTASFLWDREGSLNWRKEMSAKIMSKILEEKCHCIYNLR